MLTPKPKAKELFLQVIKDVKCDSDFEELNPIKVTDEVNLDEINEDKDIKSLSHAIFPGTHCFRR